MKQSTQGKNAINRQSHLQTIIWENAGECGSVNGMETLPAPVAQGLQAIVGDPHQSEIRPGPDVCSEREDETRSGCRRSQQQEPFLT
jgi:hypothetical protein